MSPLVSWHYGSTSVVITVTCEDRSLNETRSVDLADMENGLILDFGNTMIVITIRCIFATR